MVNVIYITGVYKLNGISDPFSGTITLIEKERSIYYSWNLNDIRGQLVAGKYFNVAFEMIPETEDKFEFAKKHSLQGILQYRMGREKIIQELNEA